MRKANQTNTAAAILAIDGNEVNALEIASSFVDTVARNRLKVSASIANTKKTTTSAKREIMRLTKLIMQNKEVIVAKEKELAAFPDSKLSIDAMKQQLEQITKLPWVESVLLKDSGHSIIVRTRENVLKTTFHNRMVYQKGQRALELLDKPLVLPMPQYEIHVRLQNMGHSWDRNNNLSIRIPDISGFVFMPDVNDIGWNQVVHGHWAAGDNGRMAAHREGDWGALCLNHYADSFEKSGKHSIIELLNEIVVYLQNAGWANAYRNKMEWAITLGCQTYITKLTRPLLQNESFEMIQEDTRVRLPAYLKEAGISQHEYQYGAPAEGEQIQTPNLTRDDLLRFYINGFARPMRNRVNDDGAIIGTAMSEPSPLDDDDDGDVEDDGIPIEEMPF